MKKFVATSLVVSALSTLLSASAALAGTDGTASMTVTGSISSVTCTVGTTGPVSLTTTLPTMPTSLLPAVNATTGKTSFTLTVSGCTGNNSAGAAITSAMPYFDQSSLNIDQSNGHLANTSTGTHAATGVQLMILEVGTGNPVMLNQPWSPPAGGLPANSVGQRVSSQTLSGTGSAAFPFFVQYYATAQTTAGLVSSSVPVIMQYN